MKGWRIVVWQGRWSRRWYADLYLIVPEADGHPEVAERWVRVKRAPTAAQAIAAARDAAVDADGGDRS